jgi:hypothetical protein
MFHYHSNPAFNSDDSEKDDPYQELMQAALAGITYGWEEGTDEDDNKFPDKSLCRLFIFIPKNSILYATEQGDALNWLVGQLEKLTDLKPKVLEYEPEPGFRDGVVEVQHDGVNLPKVLLNGKQVTPVVPDF